MIISGRNRRLKDIRRLARCKGDQALLEGPHLVAEALDCDLPLAEVLASPEFLLTPEGQRLAARLDRPPTEVEARLLASLADADAPQGVLAVAGLPRRGVASLPIERDRTYLFAEAVQDPGNLGALARVAEAAGACGLALSPGTVHPNHPRALRASAGSLLRLPVATGVEAAEVESHLRAVAPRWLCLVSRGGASLFDAPLAGTILLAVGSEGAGLSAGLAARADLRLTIPLAPPVESLNVAVAAALALFEIRRRGGRGRPA
jgi:TrmH family RNA methyltransferase